MSDLVEAAVANHTSWFACAAERVDLDGVALFLGRDTATIAFPRASGDLSGAVALARRHGVREVACWAAAPDAELGRRLAALGFQDGWQPHWMGIETAETDAEPAHAVEESPDCALDLPYAWPGHGSQAGARHFAVRDGARVAGHAVLHVAGEVGGLYDMGVAPDCRRRGLGTALAVAAVHRARELGCARIVLNATGEGEHVYRRVGFRSAGLGMTWWLFPR